MRGQNYFLQDKYKVLYDRDTSKQIQARSDMRAAFIVTWKSLTGKDKATTIFFKENELQGLRAVISDHIRLAGEQSNAGRAAMLKRKDAEILRARDDLVPA